MGRVLVVSGTGTDVGKTVVTAAVSALARTAGLRVAVVKPVQTGGAAGAASDLDEIERLAGIPRGDLFELARYDFPLSPEAAARLQGAPALDLDRCALEIRALAADRDLVLVEGAGGLLVRYDPAGRTVADLAALLNAPVLVVVLASLGTLNHTALTLEALDRRGLRLEGVVIGSWPVVPDIACRANVTDLELIAGGPLLGALAEGSGRLDRTAFAEAAAAGLASSLGGRFDAADFRRAHAISARSDGPGSHLPAGSTKGDE
jgi:dethiobiotin synthetase